MNIKEHTVRKNPSFRIITAEKPNCYAAEAYRRIKICIDALSDKKSNKVIQITSAIPGDGKTTTLLNIAISYAESGKRVLLLDLDLRKPKIHRAFHAENVGGISEYISGSAEMSQIIKHSNYKNVDYICAGPSPVRPSTLLSSGKLNLLLEDLRSQYDIILIDEPPVLVSTDSCIISRLCDAAVFQLSRKNTDKKAAQKAVKILKQNGVNILGCVFTEVDNDSDEYSYNYR